MAVSEHFVVTLERRVPESDLTTVAARVSPALDLDTVLLLRWLSRPPGPLTHPTNRERAERILAMLQAAGVDARLVAESGQGAQPLPEGSAAFSEALISDAPASVGHPADGSDGAGAEEAAGDAHEQPVAASVGGAAPARASSGGTDEPPWAGGYDDSRWVHGGDGPPWTSEGELDQGAGLHEGGVEDEPEASSGLGAEPEAGEWIEAEQAEDRAAPATASGATDAPAATVALGELGWMVREGSRRPASKRVRAQPPGRDSRRRRRLVLTALLVVASTVLGLLRASPMTPDGAAAPAPPGFSVGLEAYQRGRFAQARKAWEGAAAAGDARAQYMLGYLSEHGLGQSWSNAGAARWYRLAAEQGASDAQAALAGLYARGMGVPLDQAEARLWYRRAADGGEPGAALELARMQLLGLGGPADPAAALSSLERARQLGSAEAAALLELVR